MTFLEKLTTRSALAVIVKDDLDPGKLPQGELYVKPQGMQQGSLLKKGNYLILTDLPKANLTLSVGGTLYKEKNYSIDFAAITTSLAFGSAPSSPKIPSAEVWLKPRAIYPFPDNITLLKGKIVDIESRPVASAAILVADPARTSETDEAGYFYILFNPADGGKAITLAIQKDGYSTKTLHVTLNKNTQTFLGTVEIIPI